ncbi:Flagellar basal-body P-ring formation protein FlgA [hydrothermal vent metagenome]|uniref:Flagellar basal-body P-ring formation protein FlgA n=1 Tax=hydrothermal vent metagenome TaxID=652676 RepID=A0A3B0ZBA7_9ZZZZ
MLCASLTLLHSAPSFSSGYQSHDSIKDTAATFLMSKLSRHSSGGIEIEVITNRLDPRLRLRQCEVALEPFLPTGANLSGNTSVGIRCQDNKPWSLYVSAKIIKYADIYITTRFLPRGEQLKQGDFSLERHDISSRSIGYITDIKAIEGKILRRPLRHNSIIPPNALTEAMLIKRGDRVTILAQNTGVKVHMKGKALKNGAKGEIIRVRNLSSKRIIEGKVLSEGVVGVRL